MCVYFIAVYQQHTTGNPKLTIATIIPAAAATNEMRYQRRVQSRRNVVKEVSLLWIEAMSIVSGTIHHVLVYII